MFEHARAHKAPSRIKNLQKGRVRMPALRKRMKAPLVMMPCRMPCDACNNNRRKSRKAAIACHARYIAHLLGQVLGPVVV